MIDLNAIKARLDAATPGEWYAENNICKPTLKNVVVDCDDTLDYIGTYVFPDDADLIAHAPADLRNLIAEVERLREVVGRYERLVRGDCDLCADKDTPIKALPCCECWDKPSRPNWRPIYGAEDGE